MANRLLTWELPPPSPRRAEIDYVRIDFRVDPSLDWTTQTEVPADQPQELRFVDVAPGTFYYQATVVDINGQEGPPVETSAEAPYDLPGSVINFTATEEP